MRNIYPNNSGIRVDLKPFRIAVPYWDKPVKFKVICPRNGTAVLKRLFLFVVSVFSRNFGISRGFSSRKIPKFRENTEKN